MKRKNSSYFYLFALIIILCIATYLAGVNNLTSYSFATENDDSNSDTRINSKISINKNNLDDQINNSYSKPNNKDNISSQVNRKGNSNSQLNSINNFNSQVNSESNKDSTMNRDNPDDTMEDANAITSDNTGTIISDLKSVSKEILRNLPAGTILDLSLLDNNMLNHYFYNEQITEDIKLRIKGKSYAIDCNIPFEDLRYVRVLHYGFDLKTHIGELIVHAEVADDIVAIFKELYEAKYPIEKMLLVDEYDADDNASMADNNTSSFNYRTTPFTSKLSKHALGLAIDINPLYNPFVQYGNSESVILPVNGSEYADRSLDHPYYIKEDDICYQTFYKYGYKWGGYWKSKPDYQHFYKDID